MYIKSFTLKIHYHTAHHTELDLYRTLSAGGGGHNSPEEKGRGWGLSVPGGPEWVSVGFWKVLLHLGSGLCWFHWTTCPICLCQQSLVEGKRTDVAACRMTIRACQDASRVSMGQLPTPACPICPFLQALSLGSVRTQSEPGCLSLLGP